MPKIGETGKILIVDDHEANVRLLDIYLRSAGYQTEKAYDGEQALELVQTTRPDIILLDVMMPKLDGYEVCRRVRANEATKVIPIIMITALKDSEDRIRGLESGADDFISKPFDRSELVARVRNLLRVKFYRSMITERQKFDAVVQDLDHGIIITDENLNVTMVNRQAQMLLGLEINQCRGRNIFSLFEGFKVSPKIEELAAGAQRTVTVDLERDHTSPGLYLGGRFTRIVDPAGNLTNVAFVFRDISDERRKEKLKRDFLSLVTHKLKTPLTIVSGYLSLISAGKYGRMAPEMNKAFSLVESRVEDLKALIEKLLQYAGLSAEELRHDTQQVDPRGLIDRSVNRIMERYGHSHVELRREIPDDLPDLQVDVEQMAIVLDNLLDNAVKFTPGEHVRIDLAARVLEDGKVEFSVKDYGPGIPLQHQADIFSDFLQVEDWFTGNVGGLGLGLPTAKRLVESWGGTIRVESRPGEGSTFSFTVPQSETAAALRGPARSGGPGIMETA